HDYVIEQLRTGQGLVEAPAYADRQQHGLARDAECFQQGHQQQRLVFAISVTPLHDHVGLRGPVRTFSHRNREIADLGLHELEGPDYAIFLRWALPQLGDNVAKILADRALALKEPDRPSHHIVPSGEFRELHPAVCWVVRRRGWLYVDFANRALLEDQ